MLADQFQGRWQAMVDEHNRTGTPLTDLLAAAAREDVQLAFQNLVSLFGESEVDYRATEEVAGRLMRSASAVIVFGSDGSGE